MSGTEQPPLRGMDKTARLWMLKTMRRNHWRVAAWIDLDDLIQDGYMHWQRVLDKYPDVHQPAHLMRLFQRTITGYLHDLASKRSRDRIMLDSYQVLKPALGMDDDALIMRIAKAPPEIRTFLQRLVEDRTWNELRKPFRRRLKAHRETLNERLCRIAGIEPNIDFTGLLADYFENG